jgi:hypothetical protein
MRVGKTVQKRLSANLTMGSAGFQFSRLALLTSRRLPSGLTEHDSLAGRLGSSARPKGRGQADSRLRDLRLRQLSRSDQWERAPYVAGRGQRWLLHVIGSHRWVDEPRLRRTHGPAQTHQPRSYLVVPAETSPRQAPLSAPRLSISSLNRSRSPRTRRWSRPATEPSASFRPSA